MGAARNAGGDIWKEEEEGEDDAAASSPASSAPLVVDRFSSQYPNRSRPMLRRVRRRVALA